MVALHSWTKTGISGLHDAAMFFRSGDILVRALIYAAWHTMLVILLTLMNPFGIVGDSEDRSRAVWQDIYAHNYLTKALDKHDPVDGDPTGRRDITVVLLGEAGLETLAPGRTLDALDIFDLVDQIRSAHLAMDEGEAGKPPRAIFIDMSLGEFAPPGFSQYELLALSDREKSDCETAARSEIASPFRCMLYFFAGITRYENWRDDVRCQDNPVAKLACIQRARGTPLIFADTRSDQRDLGAVADAGFEALGLLALLSPVAYDSEIDYPLAIPEDQEKRLLTKYQLYPASLLYAVHCETEAERRQKSAGARPCAASPIEEPDPAQDNWRASYWGWSDTYSSPLEVVWGIGAPSDFTRERRAVSQLGPEEECAPAGDAGGATWSFIRRLFAGIDVSERKPCFYSRSLTYEQIADASPDLVRMAFSDTLVLVGLSTQAANDTIDTSAFGQIPGVFWHAMALDNLITKEAGYARSERSLFGGYITDNDLVEFVALFLTLAGVGLGALYLVARNRRIDSQPFGGRHELSVRLLVLAAVCLWMLALVYLFTGELLQLPNQYNYAALTIVVIVEILLLLRLILQPWGQRQVAHHKHLKKVLQPLNIPDDATLGGRD